MAKKKKKPSWQKLNWWPSRQVWRKEYKGKRYYLGEYGVKFSRDTHDKAWAEWILTKARLDVSPGAAQKMVLEDPTSENTLSDLLAHAKTYAEHHNLTISATEFMKPVLAQHSAVVNDLPAKPRKSTGYKLNDLITSFVAHKVSQAKAGQRSGARSSTIKGHLNTFTVWAGDNKTTGDLTTSMVQEYHEYLLKENLQDSTKRDKWGAFKQLVTWMAEHEYAMIPANLNSRDFNFRVANTTVKTMPTADIKKLINAADDRVKLYLLLMINTGMQQTDIANIVASMLDLNKGTITRKRGKTAHQSNAPTITYKLWDETLRLMKQEMRAVSKQFEPLLVSSKGEKLVRRPAEGGRTDRIYNAVKELRKKMGNKAPALPLKYVRKAGATLLGHKFDLVIANHYLADAPSGILSKNYVPPSQAKFDIAIDWLEKQIL